MSVIGDNSPFRCVVRVLVEMIEPYKGRVYDPCCGSSGMFVQSEEFIEKHGGRIGDLPPNNIISWLCLGNFRYLDFPKKETE